MAAIRIKRIQVPRQEPEPEPEEQYEEEVVEEEIVEEAPEAEEEVAEEVVEYEEEPEAEPEPEPEIEEEPEVVEEPEELTPVKRPAPKKKTKPKSSLKSRIGKLSAEGKPSGSSGKGLSAGDKQAIMRDYKAAAEKYKSLRSQRNKLRPKFVRFLRSLVFLLRWTVKLCAFAALLLCLYLVLQQPIKKAAESDNKSAPAELARSLHGTVKDKVMGLSEETRAGYFGWLVWTEDQLPVEPKPDEEVAPEGSGESEELPVVDNTAAEKIQALEAEIARLRESQAVAGSEDLSATLESLKEYTRQNRELVERLEALTGKIEGRPSNNERAPVEEVNAVVPDIEPEVRARPVTKPTATGRDSSSIDATRRLLGR